MRIAVVVIAVVVASALPAVATQVVTLDPERTTAWLSRISLLDEYHPGDPFDPLAPPKRMCFVPGLYVFAVQRLGAAGALGSLEDPLSEKTVPGTTVMVPERGFGTPDWAWGTFSISPGDVSWREPIACYYARVWRGTARVYSVQMGIDIDWN